METGNIKIIEATDNFTRINRSLIYNLDYKVVGIYCKVMILGKSWNLNIKGLAEALHLSDKKIREAMSVLEAEGYMSRKAVKDERGKFKGWDYFFYAQPISESDRSEAGKRTTPKTDLTENGLDRKRTTPDSDNTENGQENIYRLKENINLNNSKTETKVGAKAPRARFTPPTLDEVREYFLERHNGLDAEAFIAYYESNGWMVGRNKMKNWKSAVITWEKRRAQFQTGYKQQPKEDKMDRMFALGKEMFGFDIKEFNAGILPEEDKNMGGTIDEQ